MNETIANSEQYLMPIVTGRLHRRSSRILWKVGIIAAAVLVMSLLVWQALVASGNPDPNDASLSPAAASWIRGYWYSVKAWRRFSSWRL